MMTAACWALVTFGTISISRSMVIDRASSIRTVKSSLIDWTYLSTEAGGPPSFAQASCQVLIVFRSIPQSRAALVALSSLACRATQARARSVSPYMATFRLPTLARLGLRLGLGARLRHLLEGLAHLLLVSLGRMLLGLVVLLGRLLHLLQLLGLLQLRL